MKFDMSNMTEDERKLLVDCLCENGYREYTGRVEGDHFCWVDTYKDYIFFSRYWGVFLETETDSKNPYKYIEESGFKTGESVIVETEHDKMMAFFKSDNMESLTEADERIHRRYW